MQIEYTAADIARFWVYVDKGGPCWLWCGPTNRARPNRESGYGVFSIRGRHVYAHQFAFLLAGGVIPSGGFVCHDCPGGDNRLCVRNDAAGFHEVNGVLRPKFGHLWQGDHLSNMADMAAKGRGTAGDRNPSRLYPDSVQRGDQHWSRRNPDLLQRGDTHWTKLKPERIARGDRSGSRLHPESRPRGERHGLRLHPERHGSKTKPESVLRGEQNVSAKLTEAQVIEIRRRFAAGGITKVALGREYGVSGVLISHIVTRKIWRHVE
jgi:hypothetical protein